MQTHWVNVPGQLKQQSDGLPCSNPHVDVITLQQPLQFGKVSAQRKHADNRTFGYKPERDRILLVQDIFELIGRADGEQQRPGQQAVDVELARLRIDGRTGTIRPGVGPGEQVLKTFHRSLHVLEAGIVEKQMCQWISYYEVPSSTSVSKQKQDTENI